MTAMTDGRLDPWLLDDDSAAQAAADPAAVADAAMQVLAGIGDAATMAEWRLRALALGAGDEMSRLSDHEIAARIVVAIEGGRVTLAGAPPRLLPLAPPPASAAPPPPAPGCAARPRRAGRGAGPGAPAGRWQLPAQRPGPGGRVLADAAAARAGRSNLKRHQAH